MADSEADEEFELELPEGDEIEVVDDTPPADRGRPVAAENSVDNDDLDENGESYSDRVNKRIAKETAKVHAERRAKEQAARERDEAIRIAQDMMGQATALKAQANQYEQGFVHQAKSRTEVEIEQAESDYQRAFEAGDSAKMAEAMRKMAASSAQKSQLDTYIAPPPVQQPVYQPVQQPAQQAPQVDREAIANQTRFLQDNPWFSKDQEMTNRALQLHEEAVKQAPHLIGTSEYYDWIKTLMVREYPPERFGAPAQASRPGTSPVAPVNRAQSPTGSPARRKVTLTESQVRLAKKLGITPQQYAAELIKEQA